MKTFSTALGITILLLTVNTSACKAQSFQKGQLDIDLGLSLDNTYIGPGSTGFFPPLCASVEYGITRDISLGGYLGIAGATYNYYGYDGNPHYAQQSYTDTYSWIYLIAGVRGAYHFARLIPIPKLDVYAGLMLGNDFAHSSYSTTSADPAHVPSQEQAYGGFVASVFGGARYRFTDHFGVFAELGFGCTVFNTGVNFKF